MEFNLIISILYVLFNVLIFTFSASELRLLITAERRAEAAAERRAEAAAGDSNAKR